MKVIHYTCPSCQHEFWVDKRIDNIQCPDRVCNCQWLPHTMDGYGGSGYEEVIDIQ